MPELGTITMYRGTREAAMAPATQLTDIGPRSFIRLNRLIERPYDTKTAVYRITVKGDEDPATTFAEDNRQTVKNVQGSTFDLHVQAVRSPQPMDHPSEAKEEFTKSCFYLNSDDARVKELAAKAVAQEKDPWRKAQWIERWVHDHVTLDNSVPFAGADKVAENLKGDCRHKAMLAAALCRAVGVPSRTAVGLVYTNDRQSGPVMAFHMWAEVWVSGQWVAIDGTLGQGSVGADHIKIADASWYETQSLTPLLPVARVLGKVSIEVLTVNGKE
jgi:transglutaminase-like putative cysteine protease